MTKQYDDLVFPHHKDYNGPDKKRRLVFGILDWDDPSFKPMRKERYPWLCGYRLHDFYITFIHKM